MLFEPCDPSKLGGNQREDRSRGLGLGSAVGCAVQCEDRPACMSRTCCPGLRGKSADDVAAGLVTQIGGQSFELLLADLQQF